MKRKAIALLLVGVLLAGALSGCQNSSDPVTKALAEYSRMLKKDLPGNLRLTIYYISPTILTRRPLSKEELMTDRDVVKIIVEADELAEHRAILEKLNPSILQPVKEETYINARLYYVFEVGASNKILEVIISEIHGSVFVNGTEVEHHDVFYELIDPFLSEEDRDILGY